MIDLANPDSGARELCMRQGGGIEVTLSWLPGEEQLRIEVVDAKLNDRIEFPVAPADALRAFRHPYVHAAARGILTALPWDRRHPTELYLR